MQHMITWRAASPRASVRLPVGLTALSASALVEGWVLARWWPMSVVAVVTGAAAIWGWLTATAVTEPPTID